jgi:valyl-tRNA synthetase
MEEGRSVAMVDRVRVEGVLTTWPPGFDEDAINESDVVEGSTAKEGLSEVD